MKIDEFRIELLKEVEAFVNKWVQMQESGNPEDWPLEMDHGEWDEQFLSWSELGDEQ